MAITASNTKRSTCTKHTDSASIKINSPIAGTSNLINRSDLINE